jgi:CRISPR/Cas system-associated protein endoribonuclease Cas2
VLIPKLKAYKSADMKTTRGLNIVLNIELINVLEIIFTSHIKFKLYKKNAKFIVKNGYNFFGINIYASLTL